MLNLLMNHCELFDFVHINQLHSFLRSNTWVIRGDTLKSERLSLHLSIFLCLCDSHAFKKRVSRLFHQLHWRNTAGRGFFPPTCEGALVCLCSSDTVHSPRRTMPEKKNERRESIYMSSTAPSILYTQHLRWLKVIYNRCPWPRSPLIIDPPRANREEQGWLVLDLDSNAGQGSTRCSL